MNYLYGHLFMTTFLFISGFIINNTGNCGIKKDYCINYARRNRKMDRRIF